MSSPETSTWSARSSISSQTSRRVRKHAPYRSQALFARWYWVLFEEARTCRNRNTATESLTARFWLRRDKKIVFPHRASSIMYEREELTDYTVFLYKFTREPSSSTQEHLYLPEFLGRRARSKDFPVVYLDRKLQESALLKPSSRLAIC
jgi:hypothetical protein